MEGHTSQECSQICVVFSRGCDRARDLQLKLARPGHGSGLNQSCCHICTLTLLPNLLSPSEPSRLSPRHGPCWVAHTQTLPHKGILPHHCVPLGPTFHICNINPLRVLGVSSSPWEANQDFWVLPHDSSTICTRCECLEKNPSPGEVAGW